MIWSSDFTYIRDSLLTYEMWFAHVDEPQLPKIYEFPEKLQMAFDLSRPLLQKILLQIFQKIWTFAFIASIASTQKK